MLYVLPPLVLAKGAAASSRSSSQIGWAWRIFQSKKALCRGRKKGKILQGVFSGLFGVSTSASKVDERS